MGLGVRTAGGIVVAACALSLSGAAALPVAERMVGSGVASVTQVADDTAWSAAPSAGHVTAFLQADHAGEPDPFVTGAEEQAALRVSAAELEIPPMVLEAYERAAERIADDFPECGLRWEILAGIGKIESGHARNGRLQPNGDTMTPIIGPVLNGVGPVAAIRDTDGGEWDGDTVWDRAVGPMQFIPGTWRAYGVDGSGNGDANPHNIWDATLSAGQYLCAGGADLTTDSGLRSALLRYNRSTTYVANVISWINAYADGSFSATAGGARGTSSTGSSTGSTGSSTGSSSDAVVAAGTTKSKSKQSPASSPAGDNPSKAPAGDKQKEPARDPQKEPARDPDPDPKDPDPKDPDPKDPDPKDPDPKDPDPKDPDPKDPDPKDPDPKDPDPKDPDPKDPDPKDPDPKDPDPKDPDPKDPDPKDPDPKDPDPSDPDPSDPDPSDPDPSDPDPKDEDVKDDGQAAKEDDEGKAAKDEDATGEGEADDEGLAAKGAEGAEGDEGGSSEAADSVEDDDAPDDEAAKDADDADDGSDG